MRDQTERVVDRAAIFSAVLCCALAVGSAVLLAGCGGSESSSSAAGPGSSTTSAAGSSAAAVKSTPSPGTLAKKVSGVAAAPASPAAGSAAAPADSGGFESLVEHPRPAPGFDLPQIGNGNRAGSERVSLASLKGKVVLLNFWATWCQPCVHEMPELDSLYHHFRDRGLAVIGITAPPMALPDVEKLQKQKHISYPLLQSDQKVLDAYAAAAPLPQTFLLDRRGRVLYHLTGEPQDPNDKEPSSGKFWKPLVEKTLSL